MTEQELPGIRLISTSPEHIFLQIGDDIDLLCLPFPENHEDVTWCAESAVMTEVEYVRLDIHLQTVRRMVALGDRCSARISNLELALRTLKNSFEFGVIAGIDPDGCKRGLAFIEKTLKGGE